MGIDTAVMNHLKYCNTFGDFNDTITMGRQQIHVNTSNFFDGRVYTLYDWCENMLIKEFGCTYVDSMDFSNFEGANIIHDLNIIIDNENNIQKYDTVIDLGTLEHVYHINNAFINLSKICKTGGQIIHILPSDQQCGHGFWQFSPELFFSLYTKRNGYGDTEVFVADCITGELEKLIRPPRGERLELHRKNPSYVAIRTKLNTNKFTHNNVYQSDYLKAWEEA